MILGQETAKTPFSSSILSIFGQNIRAMLPLEFVQEFERVLNLSIVVLDHIESL